jgi:V/A-type H+-transporting ATPase subunit C
MKSRLLSHRLLDDLIVKPDLDSLIAELEKGPYREEITEAKGMFSGILCIEYALRQNFIRTFRKIQNFAQEEEVQQYIRLFLHRWDVQNIKTVLRGKNIHATADEIISCIVPAGELDEATWKELLKQPDVKAVIDLLATWQIRFARPLTHTYPEFIKERDLAILECALDRFYYADALAAVKDPTYNNALVRKLFAIEIDVVNLRTVLRMVRDRVDREDARRYLIAGGAEFDEEKLLRLLALQTTDEVIRELAETPYRFLCDIPEPVARTRKISAIEKDLERFLIKKSVGVFLLDPLSIAPVIGYFWAKYNEITNIRIISRCKTADFPVENLREELVYV